MYDFFSLCFSVLIYLRDPKWRKEVGGLSENYFGAFREWAGGGLSN